MIFGKKLGQLSAALMLFATVGTVNVSAASSSSQSMTAAQLASLASSNQVNIMLYDSNGLIQSELHSDGLRVDYQVDKQKRKVTEFKNSEGMKTVLNSNADGSLNINTYDATNKLISKEVRSAKISTLSSSSTSLDDTTMIKKAALGIVSSDLPQLETSQTVTPMVSSSDYFTGGYNMSNMLPSIWTVAVGNDRLGRPSTAMTQTDIQNFLVSKNSVLKNSIQVWAQNSSGTYYNTGRVVTPSTVINNASVNWVINPKVILATIQKEQGLITKTSGDVSTRAFVYCMGYGATDGGDIYADSGFDTQIDGGAHLFLTLWNQAYNLGQSGLPVQFVDSAGISLRLDNCGTYALFKYTPWVQSNLLFLQVMHSFWPGTDQNNINWN